MSTSKWTGAVSTDWADPDNWDPAGVPDAGSDVVINAGSGSPVASASIGTVNSITDSGGLRFRSAGTNTVTTFLDNTHHLNVDLKGGTGGTILNIGGMLTNSNTLRIGNATLSAPDEVTAASLDNTYSGAIFLLGSGANQALLDVTDAAGFGTAGVLNGFVRLTSDTAIEFASGEITSLAGYSQLTLDGNDAFIEDSTAQGSNSALSGLASINDADFSLDDGAAVTTTGALVNNNGTVELDMLNPRHGGSSLTVGGTLTNDEYGRLFIGTATLSVSDEVTAASLDNSGRIYLTGNGPNFGALEVSGTTTNNGAISITTDNEELAGAVGGTGSFSLSTANLKFDSSVSSGQTITEATGTNELILEGAQSFAGTISGFGTGDTIDAANFLLSGTTYKFVENSANTGGTLTLHDGSLTANVLMTGDYSKSSFTLAPDSGTGTLVKFA